MKRRQKVIRFVAVCSLLIIIMTVGVSAITMYPAQTYLVGSNYSGLSNGSSFPSLKDKFPIAFIGQQGFGDQAFINLTAYVFDTYGAIFPYYFMSGTASPGYGYSLVIAYCTSDARVTTTKSEYDGKTSFSVTASSILYFTYVYNPSTAIGNIVGPATDTQFIYNSGHSGVSGYGTGYIYHNLIDSSGKSFSASNYPASTYGTLIGSSSQNWYNYVGYSWYSQLYNFYNNGYDISPNDKAFYLDLINTMSATLNLTLNEINQSINNGNDTLNDIKAYEQSLLSSMVNQLSELNKIYIATKEVNQQVYDSANRMIQEQYDMLMNPNNPDSYISTINKAYGSAVKDGINKSEKGYQIYNPATGNYIPIDSATGEYILEKDSSGNPIIPTDGMGNSLIPLDENGNPMNSQNIGGLQLINNTIKSINNYQSQISTQLTQSYNALNSYVVNSFDSLQVHRDSFSFVRDLITQVWDGLGAYQSMFIISVLFFIFLFMISPIVGMLLTGKKI